MPKYTLKSSDLRTILYEHDRTAECRKVAEIRQRQYPNEHQILVRNSDRYVDYLDGYGWRPPQRTPVELEALGAAELQQAISADPDATARLFAYLDARGIEHTGLVSGSTLAAVSGHDARTWRRWVADVERFGIGVRRLLVAVCWGYSAKRD
jgi:hypothetical protein